MHKRSLIISRDIETTHLHSEHLERFAAMPSMWRYANTARVANECHPMSSDARIRQPRKIRFSDDEWNVIVDRARLCGRAPARYVRETALGAVPRTTRAQATASAVHQLGLLGTQLRTLSEKLTERGEPASAAEISQVLGEILEAVRQLE